MTAAQQIVIEHQPLSARFGPTANSDLEERAVMMVEPQQWPDRTKYIFGEFIFGVFAMFVVLVTISKYRDGTWSLPFLRYSEFPASGTVSVPATLNIKTVKSRLSVQAGDNDAVVQMIPQGTQPPALTLYVAATERVTVPAPFGTFRIASWKV